MREMGLQAWKWIAVGALMGILTLLMFTGLGSRRGTWLNGLRLSLWALVMMLGGMGAGCDGQGITGTPDTGPDLGDPEPDFGCVECYAPPWDPPPDAPDVPEVHEDPVFDPEPDEDDPDEDPDEEADEETDG